jgi:hypothetical protein
MLSKILGVLLMTLLFAKGASASDPVGQHGGRMVHAGDYHVEMVTKSGVVDIYLADHANKAVPSQGYKGLAILAIDGKSERIILEPAGNSRLSGKAAGELPDTPKGVVQITRPNGKTVQARFN